MTNQEQNIKELQSIHMEDRQAHFNTDVKTATSFFTDSYIYVRDGEIHQLSLSGLDSMYSNYFKDATFHEWDDLEQPIINISDDGTMAWVIEHFRIRISRQEDEQSKEQISEYAGITIYEKNSGNWLRVANASTFKKQQSIDNYG